MFFLEESLEEARELPPLGKRVENLFTWLWQFTTSTRPTYIKRFMNRRKSRNNHHDLDGVREEDEEEDEESNNSSPTFLPHSSGEHLTSKDVFKRDTILLLITYFIFQLANISYNSLYPIFAEEQPPTGRGLKPEAVGLSLAFAGVITIVFQIGIYGKLREKIGNKVTYRVSLGAFVVAFLLMPWVGYKKDSPYMGIGTGRGWLWTELGIVLVIKTVASVGGLTSALLLVSSHVLSQLCDINGTPDHEFSSRS